MSKPLSKSQIQLKKCRRLKSKSLKGLLLHRFLNHYGYDKGEITAKAIIDDILKLIDDYFLVSTIETDLHHLHYGQLVWMAAAVDAFPKRNQSIAETRLKPVVLSFVTEADIDHIAHGFQSAALRKKRISAGLTKPLTKEPYSLNSIMPSFWVSVMRSSPNTSMKFKVRENCSLLAAIFMIYPAPLPISERSSPSILKGI